MRAVAGIAATAGISCGLAVVASPDRLALIRPMPSSEAVYQTPTITRGTRRVAVGPPIPRLEFGTANIHPADLPPALRERKKAPEAARQVVRARARAAAPADRPSNAYFLGANSPRWRIPCPDRLTPCAGEENSLPRRSQFSAPPGRELACEALKSQYELTSGNAKNGRKIGNSLPNSLRQGMRGSIPTRPPRID
jgi:hypothetical protein